MKHRIMLIVLVIILGICFLLGIYTKTSFTDIVNKDNYMEKIYVAEIPDSIVENTVNSMMHSLPESTYIIKVKATGNERVIFRSFMQEVEVLDVLQGENKDINEGETIFITKSGWSLYCKNPLQDFGYMIKEYGFVNKMIKDKEYLIFLDHKVDTSLDKQIEHPLFDVGEYIVDPIFCYDEISNVVIEKNEDPTYVPYKDVCDNEFFACSEIGMNHLEQLKSEMLSKYR